jgi:hypothetical protein
MKKYSDLFNYKGKTFRYNYERNLVEYVFVSNEDDDILGWKKGDIIECDAVGLKKENWENKTARREYLSEYIADLEYELQFYAV